MEDAARFCSQCGTATPSVSAAAPPPPSSFGYDHSHSGYRPLVRLRNGRWIAGVCTGLARYWGLDPVLVRILFIALALCPVLPAIIPYIVCWIVMPQEPEVAASPAFLPMPAGRA
jgi:phage shock protein PspC (stress-responsive transcriptional regulator)